MLHEHQERTSSCCRREGARMDMRARGTTCANTQKSRCPRNAAPTALISYQCNKNGTPHDLFSCGTPWPPKDRLRPPKIARSACGTQKAAELFQPTFPGPPWGQTQQQNMWSGIWQPPRPSNKNRTPHSNLEAGDADVTVRGSGWYEELLNSSW